VLGQLVKQQINDKVKLTHPTQANVSGHLNYVTFYAKPTRPEALYKCVHVFSAGQLDRSPGGTGTCAMMALLLAQGKVQLNQPIHSEGLLGSGSFEGCLVRETRLGAQQAVVPTIKGKANITGYAKWVFDPADPVGAGFLVS
jgi:proline racemase